MVRCRGEEFCYGKVSHGLAKAKLITVEQWHCEVGQINAMARLGEEKFGYG